MVTTNGTEHPVCFASSLGEISCVDSDSFLALDFFSVSGFQTEEMGLRTRLI